MTTFRRRLSTIALYIAAALVGCYSCIKVDNTLGSDLLPLDQQFDTYTAIFPLEDIELRMADSLSGYSQTRITFGSIRDEEFGLTRRGSVVTLVPCYDSLDFGTNPEYKSFKMSIAKDTVSVADEADQNILQSVNVYAMDEPTRKLYDINALETGAIKHGTERITKGVPVFNGSDETLDIEFSDEYGSEFMRKLISLGLNGTQTLDDILNVLPGVYFETNDPVGNGGRINMFDLQLGYDSQQYALLGNFAELAFRSTYEGREVDTSFLFYYSPDSLYKVDSMVFYGTAGTFPQHCLNVSSQQSRSLVGEAGSKMYVEGAGGLKPVIPASEIRSLILNEIGSHGGNEKAIINKVSLILPFEWPEQGYKYMDKYPQVLSPTCRIRSTDGKDYAFANLTDYSATNENQGDIDRSNLVYCPDITYHAQMLLRKDAETVANGDYDIWFLIMYKEIDKSSSTSAYDQQQNDYYNQLMYANYYNNMYGGYGGYGYGGYGYGGYGGYGGYNDYYSNYYSYALMAQYMNQGSGSQVKYNKVMDKDRYYHASLYGPKAADESKRPRLRVTYSIPKVAR